MDDFISSPRQTFVDAARGTALESPRQLSKLEIEELSWARANPAGKADPPEDTLLVLWNFDVGRSILKSEHLTYLKNFLGALLLGAEASETRFTVIGHASTSGSYLVNQRLAQERALAVTHTLKGFGFRYISSQSRSAAEPRDSTTTGLALARNRRVEIRKEIPSPTAGAVPAPEFFIPESEKVWKEVPRVSSNGVPLGVAFESPFPASLGTWTAGDFSVSGEVEGKLKLTVRTPGAKDTIVAALKDKSVNAAFERPIREGVKAKLTLEPAKGKPTMFKAGFQAQNVILQPEIGLQLKPEFIYINFTIPEALPFGTVLVYGNEVSLEFTGKFKFNIGLSAKGSAKLAARVGRFAAPAVEVIGPLVAPAAVAVGVIGVALTITGSTIYAIEWSKEEGVRKCQILAARDAFGSRVALEIVGSSSIQDLKDRIQEWKRFQDERVRQAASEGYNKADQAIKSIKKDQLAQRVNDWKTRYGRQRDGSEDLNFTNVRERIFYKLGGYNFDSLGLDLELL
jgi:outer membrane protein OmpA-like peptidoglycan-associated protein